MSSGTKMPLSDAVRSAEDFARLILPACERYMVAGSVRRQKPEVGDIEHVAISKVGEFVPDGAMFQTTGYLLLHRLDELRAAGTIEAQVKIDGRTRWGDRYRACVYQGRVHEVFLATDDNWGAILAIRTGPAELSQDAVTRIKMRGRLRQQDGYLVYQNGGERYPCATEEAFFGAAGMECVPPQDR